MLYIVYGTRAELIKFSPLIRELRKRKVRFKTVDTGQHDNDSLHRSLRLPMPDIHLGKSYRDKWSGLQASSVTYPLASVTALLWGLGVFAKLSRMISGDDVVVTHGNTMGVPLVIVAAKMKGICSGKRGHRTVHMESGFRGRTKSSRFLDSLYRFADRNSDLLFTPYKSTEKNLKSERVVGKIVVSGDVMKDVVRETLKIRPRTVRPKNDYILANITRSIVDKSDARQLLHALKDSPIDVIFVMNPMIRKKIDRLDMSHFLVHGKIRPMPAMDYPDFLHLMKGSRGVVTDSTGVEEECAMLSKPCVVTNDFLQIPELERSGVVEKTGCNYVAISRALKKIAGGKWRVKKSALASAGSPTKKIADYLEKLEGVR